MCQFGEHFVANIILSFFRAHESWNLDQPPDYVTFAKKMQIGGFYYNDGYTPYEVRGSHYEFIVLLKFSSQRLVDNLLQGCVELNRLATGCSWKHPKNPMFFNENFLENLKEIS